MGVEDFDDPIIKKNGLTTISKSKGFDYIK